MTELQVCTVDDANQGARGDGLIDPSMFPAHAADLDPGAIRASATNLRTMGTSVERETTSINTTWSGLPAHYEAPEQQQVYDLLVPAVTSAGEIKTAMHSAAGFIDTFADTLEGIKPRLAAFETRAQEFHDRVKDGVTVPESEAADASLLTHGESLLAGIGIGEEEMVEVPWNQDTETVEENTALLEEYAGLLEEVSQANATCANAINGLLTGVCVAPVEAIPAEAFTNPEQPMPWGNPVTEDRNCGESTWTGASNFVTGTLEGGGMLLLGYNPETGDFFDGGAYGQAWGGLGNLVGSTLVMAGTGLLALSPPLGWVALDQMFKNPDVAQWMDDRANTTIAGWGSFVGYDHYAEDPWHKWKEDGIATGTESVLNIGTFFIPGGQVAGAIKGTSMAARVGRMVLGGLGTAGDFAIPGGSLLVRGGVRVLTGLDNLPPVGRIGDDLVTHLDDLPPVSRTTPEVPVSTQLFDGPRVPQPLPGAGALADGLPDGSPSTPDVPTVPDGPGGQAPETPTVPDGPGAQAPETPTAPEGPGAQAPETPTTPDGTGRTPDAPSRPFDPETPAPETIPAKDAPSGYTPDDVQQALDDAPVDAQGRPVDPRTGEPLNLTNSGGDRGWEMRWDPDSQEWVAQNRGSGVTDGLPATGEPGSFGYDADGNRLPYANDRPAYAPGQVDDVFENTHDMQVEDADAGVLVDEHGNPLAAPGENQVWVQHVDDTWHLITWEPNQPRSGLWDMGHLPDAKYSELRQRYLSGEISLEEFLDEYRDPDNYVVQDPLRNQSHIDE